MSSPRRLPSIELAPPPPPPPPITLVLNTDLGAQRLTVIENGKAKYTWPISSGRRGYATPTGTFHPQWASKMWHSRQYEYAPMPHAVFFHRGTAFHGTSAVGLLGQPASHGCVRLAPGNAAQLFKLVHKHGYASTKVVVHGGSKSREPAVARRGSRAELAVRAIAPARRLPREPRLPASLLQLGRLSCPETRLARCVLHKAPAAGGWRTGAPATDAFRRAGLLCIGLQVAFPR